LLARLLTSIRFISSPIKTAGNEAIVVSSVPICKQTIYRFILESRHKDAIDFDFIRDAVNSGFAISRQTVSLWKQLYSTLRNCDNPAPKSTLAHKERLMANNRRFYAHSGSCQDRSDWQFLDDHLIQVAKLAADFATIFNAAGLAHIAGLLHDLGKYTEKVQRRIAGENIRAEHAVQGARQAIERYGNRLDSVVTRF
jgi:hypothetical protein